MPRSGWPDGRDRGSGSVLVLALVAVLAVGALATAAVGRAAAARHVAASAADLSALAAAAAAWPVAAPGRCTGAVRERAASVATANGARLTACTMVDGSDVVVEVQVPVPGLLGGLGPARAAARAGPARSTGTTRLSATRLSV